MRPLAMVGAVVGGAIGAVAWGGIAAATNFEIGYMATGVGFLVGFGSALLGGRGVVNGILCGIIALLSIFGGKLMALRFVLPGEVRKELMADPRAAETSKADIDRMVDEVVSKIGLGETVEAAQKNLDVIDIVFAAIGVAAAFRIGSGGNRQAPARVANYGQIVGEAPPADPTRGTPQTPLPTSVPTAPQTPPPPQSPP